MNNQQTLTSKSTQPAQGPPITPPEKKKMDPAMQVVRLVIIIIGLPFVLAIIGLIVLWI